MSNDKMREEFEAWAAVKFAVAQDLLAASRTEEDMDSGFPYRIVNQQGEQSDLVNTLVGAAWSAWQASRAAVVVELPSVQCLKINDCDAEQARAYCQSAIEDFGLKVAP